jgi:hypothetical protein
MKTVVGRVQTVRVDIGIFGAERLVDRKGEMTSGSPTTRAACPSRARQHGHRHARHQPQKSLGGNARR